MNLSINFLADGPLAGGFLWSIIGNFLADGPLAGGFLWSIIIGIIVGAIAKFLTPGRDPGGCIITMLIGIVGAAVATAIGRAVGFYNEGQTAGLIPSIIGAVIVLAIYHLITRGRGRGV